MLLSLLILGLAVKTVKDLYYTGTENLTLIGTNDKVIDFLCPADRNDTEFAGRVDIDFVEIEELYLYLILGKKQQKILYIIGIN